MTDVALVYDNPNPAQLGTYRPRQDQASEIIRHLSVGIGVENADGVLLECNQAFADYYSMAADDLIGIGFMERMELICPHVVDVNGQPVPGGGPMAAFFSFQTMQCDARGSIQTTLRDGRSFRHERRWMSDGNRLVVVSELTAQRRLEAELRAVRTTSPSASDHCDTLDSKGPVAQQAEPAEKEHHREPVGVCELDMNAARLFGGDGTEIPITAMEFSLLRVFTENRGRILNRDQLLADAHAKGWDRFDRSIDLRVSRLRKKIEANPAKPQAICTVRGLGYVLH